MYQFLHSLDLSLNQPAVAEVNDKQNHLQPAEITGRTDDDAQYNYCADCKIPMESSGTEYNCAHCGMTRRNEGEIQNHDDTVNGSIRIGTGQYRGKFYNINSDYTKIQRKMVFDQLIQNQSGYPGPTFPLNVLNGAATQYNNIQKSITEPMFDDDGNVTSQKKFVRRGNIKDEVLAALIYFECIREGVMRKKKDVALFMKLSTGGFSRGEGILRDLHAEGKIDIPVDDEPVEGYIDRYLEAIKLENDNYGNFIKELVDESYNRKIGMKSQITSKVVGAIWIVITNCKLKITASELEQATDNTKKNTFMKFAKEVYSNMATFGPIFTKNGIPKV